MICRFIDGNMTQGEAPLALIPKDGVCGLN